MEIFPGIHLLPGGGPAFPGFYPPNVYLIDGAAAGLMDTGLKDQSLVEARLQYLRQHLKGRLQYIFITHGHPDHLGGARFLRQALGGRVVAHRSEEDRLQNYLESGDYILVDGGERFPLGDDVVEVIATPGHCPGHVCYLLTGQRVLFSGDHVPGRGTTVIIPPRGDMRQYLESLQRLLPLGLRAVFPGHGPVITNPEQKIRELRQHRLAREAQVLELLTRGEWSTGELVQEIYPELEPRLAEMARGQLMAHLRKLRDEGRAAFRQARWTEGNGEVKEQVDSSQ